MSRNLTVSAASRNAIPIENTKSSTITGMTNTHSKLGCIPLISANMIMTRQLIERFISADIELVSTIRYRGILILRIRSPLFTTELAPRDVASLKKFHITIPVNKDTP